MQKKSRRTVRKMAGKVSSGLTLALMMVLIIGLLSSCSSEEGQSTNESAATAKSENITSPDYDGLLKNLTVADFGARAKASQILTDLGGQAVPTIIEFLHAQPYEGEDPASFRARWEAVNLLGRIADPRAGQVLVDRIVNDQENPVRWRAIWAFKSLSLTPEEKADAFVPYLAGQDGRLQWNAAVALASLGDRKGIAVLAEGLQSRSAWRRWEAVYSLGLLGDSEAASYALGALNDDSKKVRQEAVMTLGRSGDMTFRSALLPLINDSEAGVRWRAAEAVIRLGQENATSLVSRMLARELDPTAKQELIRIRDALG
ncbi:MAG: HEAT repeat domain-containing protein [DPANN group archaeon]|nr:HEAT repeat domain-containing protein [DPANN group archaeon]